MEMAGKLIACQGDADMFACDRRPRAVTAWLQGPESTLVPS